MTFPKLMAQPAWLSRTLLTCGLSIYMVSTLPAQAASDSKSAPQTVGVNVATTTRSVLIRPGSHGQRALLKVKEVLASADVTEAALKDLTGKAPSRTRGQQHKTDGNPFASETVEYWTDGQGTYFDVEWSATRKEGTELRGTAGFTVIAPAEKNPAALAEKMADACVKRLGSALDGFANQDFNRNLDHSDRGLRVEKDLLSQSHDRLASLRKELESIGGGEMTANELRENLSQLTKQRQALDLELAGQRGRSQSLQDQVARLTKSTDKSDDDQIVRNLQKVAALREKQLDRAMQAGPSIGAGEIDRLREAVFLAQVEVDRARRESSRGALEQIDKLNAELTQSAIASAESEAKLKLVKSTIEESQTLLAKEVQQVAPIRSRLAAEASRIAEQDDQIQRQQASLARMSRDYQPIVVEAQRSTTSSGASVTYWATSSQERPSAPASRVIDVTPLEEWVKQAQSTFKKLDALNRSGARGGESENVAQAKMHVAIAKARLAQAQGDTAELRRQREAVVEAAQEFLTTATASYDAGTLTLDLVLAAQKALAEARLDLGQLDEPRAKPAVPKSSGTPK